MMYPSYCAVNQVKGSTFINRLIPRERGAACWSLEMSNVHLAVMLIGSDKVSDSAVNQKEFFKGVVHVEA